MADAKTVLATTGNPLYAMFVDFEAACCSAPKEEIMFPLAEMGVLRNVLYFLLRFSRRRA